ncbi:MAG: leucine-rich repeat domain-containing protein [Clostridia bacterium]|nr:leucine-rich repeat domain-containing protein [Clostridia bacterium]
MWTRKQKRNGRTRLFVRTVAQLLAIALLLFAAGCGSDNGAADGGTVHDNASEPTTAPISETTDTPLQDSELEGDSLEDAETGENDDFLYTISDNQVIITGYWGPDAEFEVPSTIEGYPVTAIGNAAFSFRSDLTQVTLPDSVVAIGDGAFYYCSALTSVDLGANVRVIYEDAFYDCENLTSVEMGDKVQIIGDSAFSNCARLTSIDLGDSVQIIGTRAFEGCSSLSSISLDSNMVYNVGEFAFAETAWYDNQPNGQVYLGTCLIGYKGSEPSGALVIKDGTTAVADRAFEDCSDITSVTVPDSLLGVGTLSFTWCTAFDSFAIPDGMLYIGYGAFYGCISLKNVEIPNSVQVLGDFAFGSCNSLTAIEVGGNNGYYTSVDGVLFNKDRTELIQYPPSKPDLSYEVPSSVLTIVDSAFAEGQVLEQVIIPSSVSVIEQRAFSDCDSLVEAVLPRGITSIEDMAFFACNSLSSITIPDTVTRIGEDAFSSCSALTEITIPDSVTSIDRNAFSNCWELTSVTISAGVTSIGEEAFIYCTSLTEVTFEGTPPSIGENVFDSDITLYYPAAYAHLWAPNGETEWNGYRIEQRG